MPIFMRMLLLEVGPDALNTSSLDITIFTGRLDLRDSAIAIGSMNTVVLPAETAADLGGGHPQLRLVHAEDVGAAVAHRVVTLGAAPYLAEAVSVTLARQACGSM